jgi:hypothetical protein
MLFELQKSTKRRDFHLGIVNDLLYAAYDALLDGKDEDLRVLKNQILAAIWKSPDLIDDDRRIAADAAKKKLNALKEQRGELGATGTQREDLTAIVRRLGVQDDSFRGLGPMSAEEVFQGLA